MSSTQVVPGLSLPHCWTASKCLESPRRWWVACCACTTYPAPGCLPASTSPPSLHPSQSCTTSTAASASQRRAGLRAQSLPCSPFSVLGQVIKLKIFNEKHYTIYGQDSSIFPTPPCPQGPLPPFWTHSTFQAMTLERPSWISFTNHSDFRWGKGL